MNAPFVLVANQAIEFFSPGDFFRILASDGPLTVTFYAKGVELAEAESVTEGYAERFFNGGFDRVRLVSATTQTVQVVSRLGSVVNFDAPPVGATDIVSSVPLALDAATLAALDLMRLPLLPGANWKDTSTAVANTPLTVVAPGANVNGILIHKLESFDVNVNMTNQVFIAKASAPASVTDGEVIAQSLPLAVGTNVMLGIRRETPTRVAPGLGLYFISTTNGQANSLRSARYTLL